MPEQQRQNPVGSEQEDVQLTVTKLTALLTNPDARVRACAAYALGGMKSAAKTILPKLSSLIEDPDPWVRGRTARAMGCIGCLTGDEIQKLVDLLEDPVPWVRGRAARALGVLRPVAEMAIPMLIKLLDDPDPLACGNAASALGSMTQAARDAIPKLVGMINHPEQIVRAKVSVAIGKICGPSEIIMPSLNEVLAYPEDKGIDEMKSAHLSEVITDTIKMLSSFGSAGMSTVPALVRLRHRFFKEEGHLLNLLSQLLQHPTWETADVSEFAANFLFGLEWHEHLWCILEHPFYRKVQGSVLKDYFGNGEACMEDAGQEFLALVLSRPNVLSFIDKTAEYRLMPGLIKNLCRDAAKATAKGQMVSKGEIRLIPFCDVPLPGLQIIADSRKRAREDAARRHSQELEAHELRALTTQFEDFLLGTLTEQERRAVEEHLLNKVPLRHLSQLLGGNWTMWRGRYDRAVARLARHLGISKEAIVALADVYLKQKRSEEEEIG